MGRGTPLEKERRDARWRYLILLGRTLSLYGNSEGWDVGREEVDDCCWIYGIKILRSPGQIC
jgi:hypothetical protein